AGRSGAALPVRPRPGGGPLAPGRRVRRHCGGEPRRPDDRLRLRRPGDRHPVRAPPRGGGRAAVLGETAAGDPARRRSGPRRDPQTRLGGRPAPAAPRPAPGRQRGGGAGADPGRRRPDRAALPRLTAHTLVIRIASATTYASPLAHRLTPTTLWSPAARVKTPSETHRPPLLRWLMCTVWLPVVVTITNGVRSL